MARSPQPQNVPASILEELQQVSFALMEEFDESRGHQAALRDWSLLSNWVMQFIDQASRIPDLMEEVREQPTLGARVTTIVSVDSLRLSMESAAEEMISICENAKTSKSLIWAHLFLKIGLKFFEGKRYDRAIDMYNQALLLCPHPSEIPIYAPSLNRNLFAMCFAFRCMAFSITERYEQSLADLDRAIKYSSCPTFTRTLFDSRDVLIAEITEVCVDDSPENPLPPPVPEAFNNPDLIGALPSLKMAYRPRLGRQIVARVPISKNVTVISEKAFAHWLAPSYYSIYCGHCMKPLGQQPFPCKFCIYLRFCSEECYEEGWDEYHCFECKYMPVLKYFSNGHLVLRMIVTHGVEECLEAYADILAKQRFPVEARMIYRHTINEILTLTAHEDMIDRFLPTGTFIAAFLTLWSRSLGIIDYELVEEYGGLVLRLLAIIRINSLLISGSSGEDEDDFIHHRCIRSEIGAGLFGASSFVNHSCDHNCNRVFDGARMTITTNRHIEAGEEITISYGPTKDHFGYRERQALILSRHFFKCVCRACLARM